MFLTPHSSLAILIASGVSQPWLVFLLSLGSHYLLDMVPHGDEKLDPATKKERLNMIVRYLLVDIIILIIYTFFILTKTTIQPSLIFIAIMGAILPDVLWGLYDVTQWKWLAWAKYLNHKLHNPLNIRLGMKWGLLLQLAFLIIFTMLII